jgi:DNA-binding transcriptional ArsR family regulator
VCIYEHMLRYNEDVPRDAAAAPAAPPDDACEVEATHPEAVARALAAQAPEADLEALADIFQLLASPTRLRIVEALTGGELCVCDISAVVGVSQSAVSHHLRQMRQMRLVRYAKRGRMAYYRLDDDHVLLLLATGLDHVRD